MEATQSVELGETTSPWRQAPAALPPPENWCLFFVNGIPALGFFLESQGWYGTSVTPRKKATEIKSCLVLPPDSSTVWQEFPFKGVRIQKC
ncbi:MAG: hypothetical protein SNJ57_13140 [Cyanobacteriota bacterium]